MGADTAVSAPPLMTIRQASDACALLGLRFSPKALRRWLLERHHHIPGLLQGGRGKWLVQREGLERALGREGILAVAALAERVDDHERRLCRLETARLGRLETARARP